MVDTIIIGGGPAGVSAALYTVRSNLKTLIITNNKSALNRAESIDNYYGFRNTSNGKELIDDGIEQARRLGAEVVFDEVLGINYNGNYQIKTNNNIYNAKTIIIATGASRSKPKIKNLEDYEGKGVSYCVSCDAFFYKNKKVAVLGNGEYALNEAIELLPIAKTVTLLTNGEELKIKIPNKIEIMEEKIILLGGHDKLEEIIFENQMKHNFDGLFIAMGTASSTDFAKKLGIHLNGKNIVVDEDMSTNAPGIYAAGDCTGGMLQINKAVYEGAKAGTSVVKFVRNLNK